MSDASLTPDVLVVGGGPAGLAAATELKRLGVGSVILAERSGETGGIPRHCAHSPFGLREYRRVMSGRRYTERLTDDARAAGVAIRVHHSVVRIGDDLRTEVATPDGIIDVSPRRIIVATGIRETPRAARLVPGERPLGIMTTAALQDLVHLRHLVPFRRPVIIGSELVAMSAILTCLGAGIRPAAMIDEAGSPIVGQPWGLFPRLMLIPTYYGAQIVDIVGRSRVERVIVRKANGKLSEIDCDGVIFTGRFVPEAALAAGSGIALDQGTLGPAVDDNGETLRPGIFAAGNVLRGVETAGWAWDEGRRVARAVAQSLGTSMSVDSLIAIERGDHVRYVMPQRLSPTAEPAFPALQLRVTEVVRGRLLVTADGRTIYERRLSARPEQRLLVPLTDIELPPGTAGLRVEVVA